MNDDYPTIDHVKELYNAEKNGGAIHFAVASSNTELINTLCIKYDLDIMTNDLFQSSLSISILNAEIPIENAEIVTKFPSLLSWPQLNWEIKKFLDIFLIPTNLTQMPF